MPDVLEKILASRRRALKEAQQTKPWAELERQANSAPPAPSFIAAIEKPGAITLIAEMKQKSPSAGVLRDPYDVGDLAQAYKRGGASALSVLTEHDFFGGSLHDMELAGRAGLPMLRKDFIFDPYQILEAKAAGAAAVLLIADMCDGSLLQELCACARQLQVETLVEVFSAEAMSKAIKTGSRLLGVNTRNLRTLTMHPDNIRQLSSLMPPDAVLVAESGLKTEEDVEALKPLRVASMLVGESLLKSVDIEMAAKKLVLAGQR